MTDRRRLLRRIVLGAALVVAAVLMLAALLMRAGVVERVRVELETRLSAYLGGEVRIQSLYFDPLRLRVVASGIRVHIPGADAPPLHLEATRVTARTAVRTLFSAWGGRVRLRELQVDGVNVSVDHGFFEWLRSRAKGGNLDLRIDRMAVSDGTLRYENRPVALAFDADSIALRAAWDRGRKALAGEVRARGLFGIRAFATPVPLDIRSTFRWTRARLDFPELAAQGSGLSTSLRGYLLFGETGGSLVAEGSLSARADLVAGWMKAQLPAVGGLVEGPIRIEAGPVPWTVSGQLRGTALRIGAFRAASAEGDVQYRGGRVTIRALRARSLGGTVTGTFATDVADARHPFETDLSGEDVDLEALLVALGRPLPLSGRARAELNLTGEMTRPDTWSGAGQILARPAPGTYPTGAEATFQFDGGVVEAQVGQLDLASADLAGSVSWRLGAKPARGRIVASGTTTSALDTQEALAALGAELGFATGGWMRFPVDGHGSLRCDVIFGELLDAEFEAHLLEGRFADEPFDEGRATVNWRGMEIEHLAVDARRGATSLSGAARLLLDPLRVEEAHFDARAIDAARLAARWGMSIPIQGSVDAKGDVRRVAGELDGTGHVTLAHATVAGEIVERAEGDVTIEGDRFTLRQVRAAGPAGEATGEIAWTVGARDVVLDLAHARVALAEVAALRGLAPVEGVAELSGDLTLDASGATGDLLLTGTGFRVKGFEVGDVEGGIGFHGSRVELSLAPVSESEWSLTAEVDRAPTPDRFHAVLDADSVASEFNLGAAAPRGLVTWSGRAEVTGSLESPKDLTAEGTVSTAVVRLGNASLDLMEPIPVRLEGQTLRAGPFHAQGLESDLTGELAIDFAKSELAGSTQGRIDLAAIAAIWPDVRASGRALVNLRASGPLAAPEWNGTLRVRNGRLRHAILGESLEEVDLDLTLAQGRAKIERASAVLGGGELRASGEMETLALRPGPFSGEVALNEVRLEYPQGFVGVYSGTLALQGELAQFLVSGKLDIVRGAYTREFADVMAGAPGARVRPPHTGPEIYLDLDLFAEDGVWVQNESARIEASVDLNVGGQVARPEVTGRIQALEGGTVRLRDTDYRVLAASLDFTRLDRIDPYIDVQAETRVQDYDISLHVQGTPAHFEYELTSNPSLSTQDILALLTTGQTLVEGQPAGSSTGTGAQADMVASYVAGALTADLERGLRSALRLDRVRINPFFVQGQADPTARVTLGKRVSKDTLLIYSADLGSTENQIYRAEWGATRKLKLAAERNSDGGLGADLSFSTRLGERRERPQNATPVASEGGSTRIREIRFVGALPENATAHLAKLPFGEGDALRRSAVFEGEQRLREDLVRAGHLEAKADGRSVAVAGSTSEVDVVYRIDAGPIVTVEVTGGSRGDRRRVEKRLAAFWIENLATEDLYVEAEEMILDDLRERGYYTAQVTRSVLPNAGGKTVKFVLDPGQEVKIEKLRIEGIESILEDRILKELSTKESGAFATRVVKPAALVLDQSTIRALYLDQGFLEAEVKPAEVSLDVDGTRANVAFHVVEGRQFLLASVNAPDPPGLSPGTIERWSLLAPGAPFRHESLRDAESSIRQALDALGYPDSKVTAVNELGEGSVHVEIKVDPGPRKTVGEVAFEGNERTRDRVIRRELTFEPGEPLSREQLIETQQKLYRLGIFRSVRLDYGPIREQDSEAQRVRVRVEEVAPLRLGVGAGYDTEGGVRGSASISHDNLGGYDRTVSLQVFASEIYWRTQLLFQDPRLFNWKLPSLFNIAREHREREGYTEDTWNTAVRVEKRYSPRMGAFLRYNLQRIDLSDVEDEIAVQEDKLEKVRLGDVGYTIAYDGRNDPFIVRQGYLLSSETRLFSPVFLSEESFVKVFLQGSYTHTFEHDVSIASAVRVGAEFPYGSTSRVPISERFFAGGDSTVRGFPRDGLGPKTSDGIPEGGQSLIVLNEEFRFPIYKSLRGVVFFDLGNVWSEVGDTKLGDLRPVLGSGLRIETPIGPIRFEYGHKLDREPDESRGEFFVSIGVVF